MKLGIVHHFDTVNHLDMVETGYSMKATWSANIADSHQGVWQAGHKGSKTFSWKV